MGLAEGEAVSGVVVVELGERESEGIYANLALIQHSPSEFIIDFARILPGVPKAKVHARIVMTPYHTKLLSRALAHEGGLPGQLLRGCLRRGAWIHLFLGIR